MSSIAEGAIVSSKVEESIVMNAGKSTYSIFGAPHVVVQGIPAESEETSRVGM